VLQRIHLDDTADRQVKTYSGGMRRRIDLAACLVGRPHLLFLDEADQLAERIAVIDHGRLLTEGTTRELKDHAGGAVVELTVPDEQQERTLTPSDH
jgi:ABC-2 type transport system ATP-binding protein